MCTKLNSVFSRQMFYPGLLGVFVNPFYFSRKGIADAMERYSPMLSGKVLDVGCGTKPYEHLFEVDQYTGLELATEQALKLGIADTFYDGRVIPFEDGQFDAVLCNQVLEHVFEPDQFVGELLRVLKPGGVLLLTVPFVWDEHEQPFDYSRYTTFGLKALAERNGFKLLRQEKIGFAVATIFQLINAYLFKISVNWRKPLRIIFTIVVMGSVNIIGTFLGALLPKHTDLYLDQIILAERIK